MSEKRTQIFGTIAVTISSFLTAFMVSALNVALPIIQNEFSVNAVTLTWVTTSFMLSNAVCLVAAGKIADIAGRKKIYIIGMAITSLTTFACGFAPSITVLLVLRVLMGVGGAMVNTTAMAIVFAVSPPDRRGMGVGIASAGIYSGVSVGPFIGGIITGYLGWRSIFFIAAPVMLLPLVITLLFLKEEWADAKGEKLDYIGSIIYAVSLVVFMYGISLLPEISALPFVLPGLVGLVGFIIYESKIKFPVFEVKLFRGNRVFSFSLIATLINYAATFGIAFLMSLYLQVSLGFPPQMAGLILATQPIMQAILSPIAGKLSDRVDPAILVSTGMGMTAIGLFLFVFLDTSTSLAYILPILVFLGIGYAFFASPNTNAIMSSVDKRYYGISSGVIATMRAIGMVFSMAVATIVFAVLMGDRQITVETIEPFSRSLKIIFLIFAVICGIGVYFSAVRGNLDRDSAGETQEQEG